jgi:hypothetical protein
MIGFQSLTTVLAERPIGNQKPAISSPSPGGEGWGEGELNTEMAGEHGTRPSSRTASAIFNFTATRGFLIYREQGHSSSINPIQGYSSPSPPGVYEKMAK